MPKTLTDREREDRAWSEKDFQAQIVKQAQIAGWRVFHVGDSRKMVKRGNAKFMVGDALAKGFPDLLLVKPPCILVIEVKRELGKTTPEQDEWLADFDACGIVTGVARPSDWEAIVALLFHRPKV